MIDLETSIAYAVNNMSDKDQITLNITKESYSVDHTRPLGKYSSEVRTTKSGHAAHDIVEATNFPSHQIFPFRSDV